MSAKVRQASIACPNNKRCCAVEAKVARYFRGDFFSDKPGWHRDGKLLDAEAAEVQCVFIPVKVFDIEKSCCGCYGMIDFELTKDPEPQVFFYGYKLRCVRERLRIIFLQPHDLTQGRHGVKGRATLFVEHFAGCGVLDSLGNGGAAV